MKTAEIETDLGAFAYWLERDWPLVKQLEAWALIPGRVRGLEPDPQRERFWSVVRAGLPPIFAFGYVYAHSTRPGLVRVEWVQQRDRPHVEGFEQTVGAWIHWRFGATVEDQGESRREVAAELEPPYMRGGQPVAPHELLQAIGMSLEEPLAARHVEDWYKAMKKAGRRVTWKDTEVLTGVPQRTLRDRAKRALPSAENPPTSPTLEEKPAENPPTFEGDSMLE